MQLSFTDQMQLQLCQEQPPPMPERIRNYFESCEVIPQNDTSQTLVTVLTKLGYLEEIPKEAIQKQKLQRVRLRLQTLKMGEWITQKEEFRTGLPPGGTRELLIGERDFYEAVIIAWAAYADAEFLKKSERAERLKLGEQFNVEKGEVELDETSGFPTVGFSERAADPQQKGIIYSLAMDWIDGGGENTRTHTHSKESPFQVRPSINADMFFEKSGRHSHIGRGLICFDSVLDANETHVTPERAEGLMKSMNLFMGTFRDLACHLHSPQGMGILKTIPSGRPVISLTPKRGSSIASFSLSPGHGVMLDEAHAHGAGFPRKTRFIAVFSDYRIP